jgi:DNA-binding CsgD family transcriptional regulator
MVVKVESFRRVPPRPRFGNGSGNGATACAPPLDPGSDEATAPEDGEALLALLAAGDPPAFATDSRDRIVFWNRGMAELLGRMSHSVVGRRCYETLQGRDVFGNRFCYANCPVMATMREGEPVCAFEMKVAAAADQRRTVGLTILKVPGARPDLFTVIHIVQPVAQEGRLAEILSGLRTRAQDGTAVPASAARKAACAPPPLTSREMEVLRHVAAGLQNKEVAQKLGLSVATIRNHIHNILEKLDVHSKLEAVSLAFRAGWVLPGDDPARPAAVPSPRSNEI